MALQVVALQRLIHLKQCLHTALFFVLILILWSHVSLNVHVSRVRGGKIIFRTIHTWATHGLPCPVQKGSTAWNTQKLVL
jgi:hypothetical protein